MDTLITELRFCDRCMMRTIHNVSEQNDIIYTYKKKRPYTCMVCGQISQKRALRPSAESVY